MLSLGINSLIHSSKRTATPQPSIQLHQCLRSKDSCISSADGVCACWLSGNMCFLELPHAQLALRKHVNKHNKTQHRVTSASEKE